MEKYFLTSNSPCSIIAESETRNSSISVGVISRELGMTRMWMNTEHRRRRLESTISWAYRGFFQTNTSKSMYSSSGHPLATESRIFEI